MACASRYVVIESTANPTQKGKSNNKMVCSLQQQSRKKVSDKKLITQGLQSATAEQKRGNGRAGKREFGWTVTKGLVRHLQK